ncbi:HEPN domain-containing protein [Streptomyces sp. NPDC058653]|uniref:HEPN domain-containing protein n=1 Tax=Streptomyces sp. NPDC058653 TaxID=3346576 RepID=UPI003664F986
MHAEQLKTSSKKWMSAALAAFSQGPESYDFAVHHAGIAAEHLLKAYLVTLDPALIADPRHLDSLLHATGHGAYASVPVSQTKTIGLMEAHNRVLRILRTKIRGLRNFRTKTGAKPASALVGS